MNEDLILMVMRMLEERASYYDEIMNYDVGGAYGNALDTLSYAVSGNEEVLRQFDYFGKEN